MPASLGAARFLVFDGLCLPSKREFAIFRNHGVDGDGVLWGAHHSDPFTVTTFTSAASVAACESIREGYRKGCEPPANVWTLVDQFGVTWVETVALEAVTTYWKCAKIAYGVNSSDTYMARTDWRLLLKATVPR